MGGFKLTGLGAGSANGDSVRYEQWIAGRAIDTAIATTGSSNAYVLASGLSLSAYATGQAFLIIPNFTNSGAATINVDTLGAKAITKNGTTAIVAGDIVSGQIYRLAYDGTQFQIVGKIDEIATQAQMEAASSTAAIVTPGRVNYHPGVCKCWGMITYNTGTPAANASHNISSLTDTGTGLVTVNFTTAMSSANYAVVMQKYVNWDYQGIVTTKSTGTLLLNVTNDTPTATDLPFDFMVFGDQ